MSTPSEHKKKQITFWKRHQSLLKLCADLSTLCGAKILCVITAPEAYSLQGQQAVTADEDTGDLDVLNRRGASVVFDSFSPESEVVRRNRVVNCISKLNDPSRHFPVDFNVSVRGLASAVLCPSAVAAYCMSDGSRPSKRAREEKDGSDVGALAARAPPASPSPATEFDLELERCKRRCEMLFGDLGPSLATPAPPAPSSLRIRRSESWSPPPSPPPRPLPSESPPSSRGAAVAPPLTFASALLKNMPPDRPPAVKVPVMYTPFGEICARFTESPSPTPTSSYETVALCSVPKQDLLSLPTLFQTPLCRNRSDEELMAISTLTDLIQKRCA